MAARVAILTPFAAPSVRGNAITVDRIARGLRERGVELRVWDLSVAPETSVEHQIGQFEPAVVHAFHALRAGPAALRLARRANVPLLVTVTGTDVNHDLKDPDSAPVVRRVLEGAAAIIVFHESMLAAIVEALPDAAARIVVIPQSAFFEPAPAGHWPPAAALQRAPGPIVLFPAGIRSVKRPLLPLEALDPLLAEHPGLELVYVGPILEPAAGEDLLRALPSYPWARHVGAVPHNRMPALLELSDVVLNCSLSEGGMANSVLEALSLGRAVLASDIPGNRSLVEDGVTGMLFGSLEEMATKADRLLKDPDFLARLGQAGRERVSARFGRDRETDGYLAAYTRLTPAVG